MKQLSSVLAMAVLLGSGVSAAQDPQDVEVSFIDNGGVSYKVNPAAFSTNQSYGLMTTEGFLVPRAGQIRNGCFASTPWLDVNHGQGKAYAFPHFTLEWWGDMNPVEEPDDTLLRLTLEVKRQNGTTAQARSYIYTGLLDLELRYYNQDRTQFYYYGRLDNLANQAEMLFGNIAISPGDKIRYSVCDLYEGGKLLIRDLTLTTLPIF